VLPEWERVLQRALCLQITVPPVTVAPDQTIGKASDNMISTFGKVGCFCLMHSRMWKLFRMNRVQQPRP
jgi:hypothetical protein